MLIVHGGPSTSLIPLVYANSAPWEKRLVVCHWDQRDAGLSRARAKPDGPAHSLELFVDDGLAVAEHLLARFGRSKLLLLGVSWGSLVGLEMVRRRPELFAAYYGAGQVVDIQRGEAIGYAALAERLKRQGATRALKWLQGIPPPPYPDQRTVMAERLILLTHPPASERGNLRRAVMTGLAAPGYSLAQIIRCFVPQPQPSLVRDLMSYDAAARGLTFDTPIFVLQGEEDIQTPTAPVADFLERIEAPAKRLVILPDLGHQAVVTDAFRQALFALLPDEGGRA
jgi:proline iminopeptidase